MYFANKTNGIKELKVFYDRYYSLTLFPLWTSINDNKLVKLTVFAYPRFKYIIGKFKYKIFGGEVLRNKALNKRTDSLLPSLLNKKSKYHSNFIPIYKLITTIK